MKQMSKCNAYRQRWSNTKKGMIHKMCICGKYDYEHSNPKNKSHGLFDINEPDLYEYNKPKDRTTKRLTEMLELGMHETGIASFGYKDIMSGLYIEKVWSYPYEDFREYMDWVRELIKRKE